MDTDGKFYLGRVFDGGTSTLTDKPLLYDPDDLTTHGIVVGMTGSGKTGLCVGLLEEAALRGLPALMIDPKGDITNMLLHFPELLPADFQPWVNPDEARRSDKSIEQAAADTAAMWRKGLADWGITPERIRALKESVQFAIFTPGSDAGIPLSILASLKAPAISWESNRENLREQISGTVTGILGLVGLTNLDPVRSREHILLSNIFENAWSQGKDLNLNELILQTQSPPFAKLGVFDVNTFFPEKDRFELAMLLNNILAAPSFQSWIEGQPLDVASLLYMPDGKPRHSIFYIAHLSEAERMFIVTLLFSAVETWMRSQTGTTTLRALIYFDEIFGYMPPLGNPASKTPMLRMLKQARAFGIGLLLATQNPVDVDYKALSNAGSWFIGKLQTDQDKQRLLDGLEGAAPGINRAEYDRMLSTLGKRVFLVHNVHEKAPVLFQTRWVMNYLAGPLTRNQIPALNQMAGATLQPQASVAPVTAAPAEPAVAASAPPAVHTTPSSAVQMGGATATKPRVPGKIKEYFLPNNLTLTQAFKTAGKPMPETIHDQGLVYRPALIGQAEVRFLERRYNLDSMMTRTVLVNNPDRRGFIRWEDHITRPVSVETLDRSPDPRALYTALEVPLNEERTISNLASDFEEWVYRNSEVKVTSNPALKLFAGPQVGPAEFRQQCTDAARALRDDEVAAEEAKFDKKIAVIVTRLEKEERELAGDETEYNQRKLEEFGTHAETLLGIFGKRKKSISSSLTKRRLTDKAKADITESKAAIEKYRKEIAELEEQKVAAIQAVNDRWGEAVMQTEEVAVLPKKTDIHVDLFGVAWLPFHVVQSPEGEIEVPGYGQS